MRLYREFPTEKAARDFRHENGTGGWIFAPADSSPCHLFPPDMPPAEIFSHPLTAGKSGRLIGAA
jgi:hypothetical protein